MFKTKGAMLGAAAALAATALLLAGMAINSTAGAATDVPSGGPTGLPAVIDNGSGGNPPASPIEPGTNPTNPTIPGINPAGGAGAGGTAPSGLPSAGFGVAQSGTSTMLLLALAAVALSGAGIATVGAFRRK
jgi:hypothetical protein